MEAMFYTEFGVGSLVGAVLLLAVAVAAVTSPGFRRSGQARRQRTSASP